MGAIPRLLLAFGCVLAFVPATVSGQWLREDGPWVEPIAFVDGILLLRSGDPGDVRVVALNATTGTELWSQPAGVPDNVARQGDHVLVTTRGSKGQELRAFEVKTGRHAWTWSGWGLGIAVQDGPGLDGSVFAWEEVCVRECSGQLVRLSSHDGQAVWHTPFAGKDCQGPVVVNSIVFVPCQSPTSRFTDGRAYAFDASDGAPRWTATLWANQVVAAADTLYMVALRPPEDVDQLPNADWALDAVDPRTGNVTWSVPADRNARLAVGEDKIHLRSRSTLQAFSLQGGNLWETVLPGPYQTMCVGHGGAGTRVFVIPYPYLLEAYDAQGALLWSAHTPDMLARDLACSADWVAVTFEGRHPRLLVVDARDGSLPRLSPWRDVLQASPWALALVGVVLGLWMSRGLQDPYGRSHVRASLMLTLSASLALVGCVVAIWARSAFPVSGSGLERLDAVGTAAMMLWTAMAGIWGFILAWRTPKPRPGFARLGLVLGGAIVLLAAAAVVLFLAAVVWLSQHPFV